MVGGTNLQISATKWNYIFARLRRITFKFGNFTNFKALLTDLSHCSLLGFATRTLKARVKENLDSLQFFKFPISPTVVISLMANEQAREDTRLRGGSIIQPYAKVPRKNETRSKLCNIRQCKVTLQNTEYKKNMPCKVSVSNSLCSRTFQFELSSKYFTRIHFLFMPLRKNNNAAKFMVSLKQNIRKASSAHHKSFFLKSRLLKL